MEIAPSMPVGLTVLVYAIQFDLDVEYATSLVSMSLAFAFPLIIILSHLL